MGAEHDGRNDEIWALAQAGRPQHEIAEKFGLSRQRVSQIVAELTPATWGFTDRDRAQVRAREAATLERLSKEAEQVIANPPLMHSAIGKAIEDPRRPGTYLINESVRVGAIRERRLLSESYRRLTGVDLATSGGTPHAQAQEAMQAALAAAAERRDAELANLDRRKADLDARERALTAVTTPQYGDGDLIEAEIVP